MDKSEPILIVRGRHSNCERLPLTLVNEGFSIIESENFEDAKSKVSVEGPFLVVSDFDLRDGSALELCRMFKQTHSRLPFLIIAEDVDKELALAALNSGVDELLETPVSAEQIKRVVKKYAQNRQRQLEIEQQEAEEALSLFFHEFEELSLELEPNIKNLASDPSTVRSLIRRIHIIRGAAASLPQNLGRELAALGLAFEEHLVQLQSQARSVNPREIELYLQTCVLFQELVQALKSGVVAESELTQKLLNAYRTLNSGAERLPTLQSK